MPPSRAPRDLLDRGASAPEGAAYGAGMLTLLGAAVVLATALGFEHLGGYVPCPLCLQQRWAYYAGIPILFVALVAISAGWREIAATLLALAAIAFLANAGLGTYHAGAEWGWWPGPSSCSVGGLSLPTSGGVLGQLSETRVLRCDEAPWRLLGLSFAGWNVVASLLIALGAAITTLRTRHINPS